MQLSLTQAELEQAVKTHISGLITVSAGASVSILLVPGGGATIDIQPAGVRTTAMSTTALQVIQQAEDQLAAKTAMKAAPKFVAAVTEIVAKADAVVIVAPEATQATPAVVSLFNKNRPPQTATEVRQVLEEEYAAEDAGKAEAMAVVEDPPFEIAPAAVVAAEEVKKPQSLFKGLRKPVNA